MLFALACAARPVHAQGAASGSLPAAASPPSSKAGAALPAAPAPPEIAPVAPADTNERIDRGLERLRSGDLKSAAALFYAVYQTLPLVDSRRDLASYHLAVSLAGLELTQAAVEHYLEIVSGRRSPELMDQALSALKQLYERRLVGDGRFVEAVLYGAQFTGLSPEVADFVEYLQALTDIRHGFLKWGRARLEVLARSNRAHSFSARYALAVQQIAQHEDDAAAKELNDIVESKADLPFEVRNQARLALARILYEKKRYEDAWRTYSSVDSPLPLQDVVMVERAWDRVASGDQQRALGLLVGLEAPVFHAIFSPERYLIRGIALRRICQYRAAHLAVRAFRSDYGHVLEKIKGRASLRDDPMIRSWAVESTSPLRTAWRIQSILNREKATLGVVDDKPLRVHLDTIYTSALATTSRAIERDLTDAVDQVADELLRIDEQMSLVDYEMGAGLFKSGEATTLGAPKSIDIPQGTDQVYFKFDGEYWSDELGDYSVLATDRCVR
jgi:TolA-binding protein